MIDRSPNNLFQETNMESIEMKIEKTQRTLDYLRSQKPELALTQTELKLARDWIKECDWSDIECDEDVDELTDEQVTKAVKKFYDGGLANFKKDCVHF